MSSPRLIDIHCHYQKQDGFLEQMIESGQAAGVEKFCLNGGGPRWNQHDNEGVMAAAAKHPETIIPIAFCYLGEDTAAEVYAWYRAGFRGLKTQCPTSFYDDDQFFPIYAAAEECRMPILFHTGISARFVNHDHWDTSSRYMMPLTFDRIARCFPDLVLWGAHLGIPDTWHAAMLMAVHPHVYFDLCGLMPGFAGTSLTDFARMFYRGEAHWGKLVFGTEGGPQGFQPLLDCYRETMAQHGVSEETQDRVFRGNAAEALTL